MLVVLGDLVVLVLVKVGAAALHLLLTATCQVIQWFCA